jgi:hypothetical protein
MSGIPHSARVSGNKRQCTGHGGEYTVRTGIAGSVTAGTATALLTVMAGLIFDALVMQCLLLFRWVIVDGLYLCAMRCFVGTIRCIHSDRKGATQGRDRQREGDDKQ